MVRLSASVVIEDPTTMSSPVAAIVEGGSASTFGDEARMIAGLGDLTSWSDYELADIAAELGLPFERLLRKQRMQKQIAQAKRARPLVRAEN